MNAGSRQQYGFVCYTSLVGYSGTRRVLANSKGHGRVRCKRPWGAKMLGFLITVGFLSLYCIWNYGNDSTKIVQATAVGQQLSLI